MTHGDHNGETMCSRAAGCESRDMFANILAQLTNNY